MTRILLALFALSAACLNADVTLRYKSDFKTTMPGNAGGQAMQQATAGMPTDTTIRVKGTKCYSQAGKMAFIGDASKPEMTVLEPESKRYAVTTAEKYAEAIKAAMPTMPPDAAGMMAGMKGKVESKPTGRTATIHGIPTEERELIFSMDGPANVPSGPLMKMVMHMWMAKAGDAATVPALRELGAYIKWATGEMNPVGAMKAAFAQVPGFGESFEKLMQEFTKENAVLLRMTADLFMPSLGAMMKNLPPGSNPFGADFNPDAPMMQMSQEATELSTAPVSEAVFHVPAGFKEAPLEEILKTLLTPAKPPARR